MSGPRALLPALVLLTGAGLPGSAAPARAEDLCVVAGGGSLQTNVGLSYSPSFTSNVSFTFTFYCVTTGDSLTGRGVLDQATCDTATGSGVFDGGGEFTLVMAGSVMTVLRRDGVGVMGSLQPMPIPDTSTIPFGNSCSNGTAQNFMPSGWFACASTSTGTVCV